MELDVLETIVSYNDCEITEENAALAHFGILGMKWGKRNGPPYPLSGEAHSKNEHVMAEATGTTVGQSSGLGGVGNMSDDQVKAAKQLQKQKSKELKKAKSDELARLNAEQKKAQHEAAKKKAIAEGDAAAVYKYFSEYSTTEIEDAVKRIGNKQKIADAIPKKKSAWKQIDSATKKLEVVNNAANAGINLYNNYAKVSNAFSDSDSKLPMINGGGQSKKKK